MNFLELNKQIIEISKNRRYFEKNIIEFINNNNKNFDNVNFVTCLYNIIKYGKSNFLNTNREIIDFLIKSVNIKKLKSRNISNFSWCLAKLNFYDKQILQLLIIEFKRKFKNFNSQHISNFIWSLAKLNFYDKETLNLLCQEFKCKSKDFDIQHISNFIWSLSKFNFYDKEILNLLCEEFKIKSKYFDSQGISNFIWALSKFNFYEEETLDLLCQEFKSKSKDFNSQGISNFIWSLSKFNFYDKETLDILIKEFLCKSKQFNSQEINNFTSALVSLNFYHKEVIEILIEEFKKKCKDFNNNFILDIATFDNNVDFVLENYNKLDKNSIIFTQVYLYLKYYKNINIPEEKLENVNFKIIFSKLQKDIYKYFPTNFVEDYILYCYCINIADPINKIAVEIKEFDNVNLKDELKYNILKSLGWKVYTVDYKIWNELTDKETYIKNLIN